MGKYRVSYNFKTTDKASKDYGILQEGESYFTTFCDAVAFTRRITRGGYASFTVYGKPIVEKINV